MPPQVLHASSVHKDPIAHQHLLHRSHVLQALFVLQDPSASRPVQAGFTAHLRHPRSNAVSAAFVQPDLCPTPLARQDRFAKIQAPFLCALPERTALHNPRHPLLVFWVSTALSTHRPAIPVQQGHSAAMPPFAPSVLLGRTVRLALRRRSPVFLARYVLPTHHRCLSVRWEPTALILRQ